MSPGEAGALEAAASKLEQTVESLSALYAEIVVAADHVREDPTGPWRSVLALMLDRLYTALEDGLSHVARLVDGKLPSSPEWHKTLLAAARGALPGVRPAILGSVSAGAAERLLAFRHFLRHAYLIQLDGDRLLERVDDATAIATAGAEDLRSLAQLLRVARAR